MCDVALRHRNLPNCSLGCFVCKVLTLSQKAVRTGTDLYSQHFKSWIPPQGTEFFTLKLFAGSAKLSKALASNSILAIAVGPASNRAWTLLHLDPCPSPDQKLVRRLTEETGPRHVCGSVPFPHSREGPTIHFGRWRPPAQLRNAWRPPGLPNSAKKQRGHAKAPEIREAHKEVQLQACQQQLWDASTEVASELMHAWVDFHACMHDGSRDKWVSLLLFHVTPLLPHSVWRESQARQMGSCNEVRPIPSAPVPVGERWASLLFRLSTLAGRRPRSVALGAQMTRLHAGFSSQW